MPTCVLLWSPLSLRSLKGCSPQSNMKSSTLWSVLCSWRVLTTFHCWLGAEKALVEYLVTSWSRTCVLFLLIRGFQRVCSPSTTMMRANLWLLASPAACLPSTRGEYSFCQTLWRQGVSTCLPATLSKNKMSHKHIFSPAFPNRTTFTNRRHFCFIPVPSLLWILV